MLVNDDVCIVRGIDRVGDFFIVGLGLEKGNFVQQWIGI